MGSECSTTMADPRTEMEAFAFRKLVEHLQMRTDVQNMDLMTLSGFCRNCLSKWLHAGASRYGVNEFTYEEATESVYNMPLKEWKGKYQNPATPEQMEAYNASKPGHAKNHDSEAPTSALPERLLSDVCCSDVSNGCLDPPERAVSAPYTGPAVPIELGVLTVSDRAHAQVYQDLSGPAIIEEMSKFATSAGNWVLEICQTQIVPDEEDDISAVLADWSKTCNLILTTGGTGFAPRDVTPEATKRVSTKMATALMSQVQRAVVQRDGAMAATSRAVIGVCGGCCIVNLPGRPVAVRQNLAVLMPLLGHVASQLTGPSNAATEETIEALSENTSTAPEKLARDKSTNRSCWRLLGYHHLLMLSK